MKSKSLEMSDYTEINEEVRSLLRTEAKFRGKGYTFNIPHQHRYWEYGSALASLREAGIEPPACILDVGCGHGPFGPWLAKLGYCVDEIDPSPQVASRADLRAAMSGSDWAFAATPLMEFKTGAPYDAVFAISVMEHIAAPEQAAAWERLASLVAPGGLLFTTVDYGRIDASNAPAREMIFSDHDVRHVVTQLTDLGFDFEEVDTEYHGDQVFDYTFFRIVGRKAKCGG